MKLLAVIMNSILTLLFLASSVFALGSGFSGITASADSAETVVSNPAGMTRLRQPSLYGNLMVAYSRDKDQTTVQNTGQKQSSSDDSTVLIPAFYYVHPLGERWAVGIGPDAVAGLGASFDDNWAGRYLVQNWSLSFVGLAPSAAYRVSDKLSVGLSVPIMYSRYILDKAVFNLVPGSADGSFELKADGWGVGLNVGVLYELTEYTRFGLVYRSKVSAKDEGRPNFSGLTVQRQELLNRVGALDKVISIDTSTPQIAHAGLFHDFQNKWSCTFDVVWVDFSEWGLDDVMVGDTQINMRPVHYKDIYAATVGVSYELTPKITARSGAFYVSSGQDDEDRSPSMRIDQIWGAGLGCEYAFKMHRSVALDMTYVQLGEGKYTVQDVPLADDIEGRYTTNYALVFGLGVKWEFGADR
jgi:long-chain fatty acid transport protein